MPPEDLDDMLERAAERGAKLALERLGLHDADAGRDIDELRTLLDAYRQTRRAVVITVIKWVTTAVLGVMAFTVYTKLGGK